MKIPEFIDKDSTLTGVAASPGVVIGKAYMVDRSKVDIVYQYLIDESFIGQEVDRFEEASRQTETQLGRLIFRDDRVGMP